MVLWSSLRKSVLNYNKVEHLSTINDNHESVLTLRRDWMGRRERREKGERKREKSERQGRRVKEKGERKR